MPSRQAQERRHDKRNNAGTTVEERRFSAA
jgi:hypothetical protein